MKRKNLRMLLCTGICAALIAGTGIISYATSHTSAAQTESRQRPEDDGSVMAKITAIDDNTLTVVTASKPEKEQKLADGETRPEKPADGETPPAKLADGETLPEKPADGETPLEKPADGETPPQRSDSESAGSHKGSRPEMEFTGETQTLTITSSTTVTKGREHESVDVSELSSDMTVKMILDGTNITSIEIME